MRGQLPRAATDRATMLHTLHTLLPRLNVPQAAALLDVRFRISVRGSKYSINHTKEVNVQYASYTDKHTKTHSASRFLWLRIALAMRHAPRTRAPDQSAVRQSRRPPVDLPSKTPTKLHQRQCHPPQQGWQNHGRNGCVL